MREVQHREFCSNCHKFRVVQCKSKTTNRVVCVDCVQLPSLKLEVDLGQFVTYTKKRIQKQHQHSGRAIAYEQRIIELLKENPKTSTQLREILDLRANYLNTLLRGLLERDEIVRVATHEQRLPHWYCLPEDLAKCKEQAQTDTEKIYQFICAEPDLWAAEIARRMQIDFGTVAYATRLLRETERVVGIKDNNKNFIKLRKKDGD